MVIGDELLSGTVSDANTSWLAKLLYRCVNAPSQLHTCLIAAWANCSMEPADRVPNITASMLQQTAGSCMFTAAVACLDTAVEGWTWRGWCSCGMNFKTSRTQCLT